MTLHNIQIIMSMSLSQSSKDPFRHLKRMKNKTPSKTNKKNTSANLSQTNILSDHHPVESKLQETALLKENCYDPNKYYSNACQQYLKKICFKNHRQENHDHIEVQSKKKSIEQSVYSNIKHRSKTNQSQDSLKEVLFSKQKNMSNGHQQVQVMTFKKLNFTEKSGSEEGKRAVIIQRQLQFDVEPDPFDGDKMEEASDNYQLKQCQICSRKFNKESYQKHVRVCQKVFVKKRNKFSSEKQRSLSKDSKKK